MRKYKVLIFIIGLLLLTEISYLAYRLMLIQIFEFWIIIAFEITGLTLIIFLLTFAIRLNTILHNEGYYYLRGKEYLLRRLTAGNTIIRREIEDVLNDRIGDQEYLQKGKRRPI